MAPQGKSDRIRRWRAHPNFVLVVVGFAIFSDTFLFACITPVLPFLLQTRFGIQEDGIQQAISTSLAAFYITSILTPAFVAFFGRHHALRKPLYMLGLLCLAVATVSLYLAQSFAVFLVSRILQGASGSIVWVVGMGMICDAVGIDGLGQATGNVFGLAMMGAMVAPAVGGAMYRYSGFEAITILSLAILAVDLGLRVLVLDNNESDQHSRDDSSNVDAENSSNGDDTQTHHVNERTPLISGAVAASTQQTSPPETHTETQDTGLRSRILSRVPILKTLLHPAMWTSIALVVFQAIALSFIDAAIPLRLRQTLGFDAFKAGLMLLTITGMSVIGAPIAGYLSDRCQPRILAVGGLLITATGLALLGLPLPKVQAARIAAYAIYLALVGLGLFSLDSPAFIASAKLVDDLFRREPDSFGGVSPSVEHQAMLYTFFSTGMVLGPLVTAGLLDIMSFEIAVWVWSAVTVALSVVTFFYL